MKSTIVSLLLSVPLLSGVVHSAEPADAGDRMKDFREAKFGMFIHWGLYAIPARGEWVMNREKIPVAQYAAFAPQFNPVKFNAEEWVRVAKDAGMKYLVITSKHHDGFAMYRSAVSSYNIAEATPFKRDPLKELAAACEKEGLRLGFYYSQAQDWHHPGGAIARGSWDPAQKGDFDQYLQAKAVPQVKELLTGYGPVFAIWFDTPVQMTRQSAEDLARLVHQMQPATYVNSRLLYSGRAIPGVKDEELADLKRIGVDYLSYADRQIPGQPQWRDWETCMTLNNSWGYTKDDDHWKSALQLIQQLVEVASKGGNFLLNVGPTAEGEIPQPSVDRLKDVGAWLKINGEAIYGTDPSPFPAAENAPTWRCTTKPGKIYIHLLSWPAGTFELAGMKARAAKAYLLADPEHKPLAFSSDGGRLAVTLPSAAPGEHINVLCVELQP